MMTFTIVVVDGGEMKSFTESDMDAFFSDSDIMVDVRHAIETYLDHMSEVQEPREVDPVAFQKAIEAVATNKKLRSFIEEGNALLQHMKGTSNG